MLTRARRAALIAIAAAALTPSLADASDIRVQGTTDTTDSGLVQDVIQPGFERAYPQYTLKYIAVGTGQALTNARSGQADAVLTHAPSAEAQFVADGYSAEPVGRAIMFNDYVITGRTADPAGVASAAPHDAVRALEVIAEAGAAGHAVFVSRGDNSGTHIQEGLMWALSTVPTHPIGAAGSGRREPDANGDGTGTDIPDWYKKAGVGQAATVKVASECNFGEPRDRCYAMTDRGTYDRQVEIGAISDVKVVTEHNAATARGGDQLLTNPFSAYAVSPAKVDSVNLPGAMAFLDYLTSEDFQTALNTYPSAEKQRFFPDALPRLDLAGPPLDARIDAGQKVTVAGTLFNRYPGSGAVGGAPLTLQGTLGLAGPLFGPVDPGFADLDRQTTDGGGRVLFTATPNRSGDLRASFARFGALSPTTIPVGRVRVAAVVDLQKADASHRRVRLRGVARPGAHRDAASLTVLATPVGAGGGERTISEQRLGAGEAFDVAAGLPPGRWRVRLRYADPRAVESGDSRSLDVTVPGAAAVALSSVRRLSDGRIRTKGTFTPGATGTAARVIVEARRSGSSAAYKRVTAVRPARGSRRYTATFRLRPGRWQLRSRYRNPGVIETTSSSSRRVSAR